MNVEVAVIFTVGSIAGAIIVSQMWMHNWLKKENFKMQKSNIMAENRIKMKKLERELGLKGSKAPVEHEKAGVLELLGGLDKDKIAGILDLLQGGGDVDDYEPEPKSDLERLISNLPPGVIEGFLKNIKGDQDQQENQQLYQS